MLSIQVLILTLLSLMNAIFKCWVTDLGFKHSFWDLKIWGFGKFCNFVFCSCSRISVQGIVLSLWVVSSIPFLVSDVECCQLSLMLDAHFCNAILTFRDSVVYFEFKPSLSEVLAHLNYSFASTPLSLLNSDLNLWRHEFLDSFMFKIIWILFFWFLILLYFFH